MNEPRVTLMSVLHVAHAVENEMEAKLSEIGLTLAKLVALRALAEAGEPVALGHLAERLSCVKSNVTQLVDRLEADGLVARAADSADRRTKLATLTVAGRRACEQAARIQEEAERQLVSGLSREEARALGALLTKLKSASE